MHKRGWRVEILSWAHSCNQRMRQWAQENGVFVALDDFYESITFMEPPDRVRSLRLHAIPQDWTCHRDRRPDGESDGGLKLLLHPFSQFAGGDLVAAIVCRKSRTVLKTL